MSYKQAKAFIAYLSKDVLKLVKKQQDNTLSSTDEAYLASFEGWTKESWIDFVNNVAKAEAYIELLDKAAADFKKS